MAYERADQVSICIGEKTKVLSPTSSECSIFRVHHHLRMVNEKAYEPEILAIGPYHCGKENLKRMEEHKIRYLQMLLRRRGEENNVTKYVMAMRTLEERARKCYAESVSLNKDEFVEMMLLDGCFVVELIRKSIITEWRDENDSIFNERWTTCSLRRDMLLIENQLPFFVLWELFCITAMPNERNFDFICMIFYFFSTRPGPRYNWADRFSIEKIKHLLGLIHDNCLPSTQETEAYKKARKESQWEFIQCATELREAGIKFRKVEGGSLFDIKFENGIMEIPTLGIEDQTESFFRNLIAYEQCYTDEDPSYFVDYAKFMDCLINSPKDVELLRFQGIITNWLGDDEVVATMFNRLGDYVVLSSRDFYYSELFNKVNGYCTTRCNKWMANLRHNYFNTPWAFVSFLAATFLVLFTFIQTVFSVLAYFK